MFNFEYRHNVVNADNTMAFSSSQPLVNNSLKFTYERNCGVGEGNNTLMNNFEIFRVVPLSAGKSAVIRLAVESSFLEVTVNGSYDIEDSKQFSPKERRRLVFALIKLFKQFVRSVRPNTEFIVIPSDTKDKNVQRKTRFYKTLGFVEFPDYTNTLFYVTK